MSESLIQVLNVSKTFKTKEGSVEALKNISLNIEKGDIFGIIGMSGAGKSTLVRCLNFLEKPTDGDVVIDGKSLGGMTEKELRKQRTDVAMIFQHFNLLMQSTVLDNVLFPMRINKKPNKKKAMELLKEVGLEDKASAYPAQLSGGQQQRVAIARAVLGEPEIILADEPTVNIDISGTVFSILFRQKYSP